jgi:pSer/pThr/pTyr-binding forkhead associated (FHA) protein
MIELVIVKAEEPPWRLALQGGSYGLGRGETNEIVLDDKEVSRRHARVIVEGDGVVVKDLDSGNGTYVAGRAVREAAVAVGGEIEIVPFRIRVARSGQPNRAYWLECIRGDSKGRRYAMTGDAMSIGRHEDQDVHIDDPGASRSHAMLVCRGGTWSVRDNQSANGILVNDRGVKEAQLSAGDVIVIGDTMLRFTDGMHDHADLDLLEPSEAHLARPPAAVAPVPEWSMPTIWLFGGLFLLISTLLFLAAMLGQ